MREISGICFQAWTKGSWDECRWLDLVARL